jgi:methyl-accepting chemotaxis protein
LALEDEKVALAPPVDIGLIWFQSTTQSQKRSSRMKIMRIRLSLKFMLPTAIVVVLGIGALGLVVMHSLGSEVRGRADQEAADQVGAVLSILQTVDDLSSQSVRSAMKVLLQEGERLGVPESNKSATIAGQTVPDLDLGRSSQVGNFALVDRIKLLTGCTATLFVKKGDQFVRVSTNVLKPDGSRAIGTALDSKGLAFTAIRDGQSFYGVVDILGAPYMTGYEPMRNSASQTVGIWYVGFPLTAVANLGERIGTTKILDHGFVALLRADGRVIAKPQDVTEDEVRKRLEHSETAEWTVISKPFDKWGYTLLAAYPQADISAELRGMQAAVISGVLLVSLLVVLAQYLLVRTLVKPLSAAVGLADAIANNDLALADLPIENQDEIGEVSAALNTMKNNLQKTVQAIAEAAGCVATASQELTATSQHISANSQKTSTRASVVSKTAQQVSQNLQTVATGAEEMGASIKEIAKHATEAAKVATSAVKIAATTTATVSKLGDSSTEIGQVIKVITSIAQQTNLLALNATIEAARAGEAGKGFAVVANEVKELAKETAKATESISQKIVAIQSDTKAAVEAIASISGVINRINDISSTIATAVEEQDATTNEMARNVSEAAQGSGEITSNVAGVAQEAESTSRDASDSQKASQQLVETSAELRRLVEQFKISAGGSGAAATHAQRRAAHAGY